MSRARQRRERAYRERAGMIGILASCTCTYPIDRYPTDTQHDEACAGHLVALSMRAAAAAATEAP